MGECVSGDTGFDAGEGGIRNVGEVKYDAHTNSGLVLLPPAAASRAVGVSPPFRGSFKGRNR